MGLRRMLSYPIPGPGHRVPSVFALSHDRRGRHPKLMSLHVAELWRYPVKSLAGERLAATAIEPNGIPGDRIVRVRGPEGVRTARRQYRLLGLQGTLDADSRPRINGQPWDSPKALALVKAAAGTDAWLEAYDGVDRFDILPLLVATDGAVGAFGRDVRRLRPNIVIGGVDGLGERAWPGAELHIGEVIIRLDALRGRCHMTTIDPDTLAVDPGVLRDIVRRFDNTLALDAEVVQGGTIGVGDAVTVVMKSKASA
jgi:MOSC domain-containing protein